MFQPSSRMVAEFDAVTRPFRKELRLLGDETKRFTRDSSKGFENVEKRAQQTAQAMGILKTSAIALGGAATIQAMRSFADAATSVDNQLRGIGAGSDEVKKKVYALAIESRTPIEATVGLLRSMQKSLKDQPLETTIRQVGTLNKLLTVGGLDGAARGAVSLQFGQALQSGVLQGDELRSLREAAPYELLEAIAKAAGGTVAQLRDLGSQGKLTRDVMVRALTDLERTANEKFGAFQLTTTEANEALRTGILAVMGAMNEGSRATASYAQIQTDLAKFMLENADAGRVLGQALRQLAEVAVILAGTRGLVAMVGAANDARSRLMLLRREAGLTAAVMSKLRGTMAFFGGPVGLAIFAAGTAMSVLNRNTESFADSLRVVANTTKVLKETPERYDGITDAIEDDLVRLEEAERKVEEAIKAQGEAAQATAQIELEAIQARIDKNKERARLEIALAENSVAAARESVAKMQADLQKGGFFGGSVPIAERLDSILRTPATSRSKSDREFLQKYQAMEQAVERIAEAEKRLEKIRQAAATGKKATDLLDEKRAKELTDATAKLVAASKTIIGDVEKLEKQKADLIKGLAEARELEDEDTLGKLSAALIQVEEKLAEIKGEGGEASEAVKSLAEYVDLVDQRTRNLTFDGKENVRKKISEMKDQLAEALKNTSDLDAAKLSNLYRGIDALKTILDQVAESIGTTRDLIEAPYVMSDSEIAARGQYQRSLMRSVGVSGGRAAARDLIIAKESFRTEAYPDWSYKNGQRYNSGWRAGYGSDTYVDASGKTHRVQQGTVITREDADRDILKRIDAIFETIVSQIGQNNFDLLTDQQQGALASLLYNYGRGEFNPNGDLSGVLAALKNGVPEAVAAEIAKLGTHNNGINKTRRMEEASAFGDTGAEPIQAMLDEINARQELTRSMTETAEARASEFDMIGKTAAQQAYLLTKFELLNEAKRRGIDLDEVMVGSNRTYREEIEEQARAAQRLVAEKERVAKAEEKAAEQTDFYKSVQAELKDGLIDSILAGRSFADVLANVADMLARAALQAALFGEGPLSGLFGTAAGGGAFGALTTAVSSAFGGSTPNVTASANGNIMTGFGPARLTPYSRGGVATSPQLSIFGEGTQPEAYVPLPDGRTIPVTLAAPQMPNLHVPQPTMGSVNIYENEGGDETRVEQDEQGNLNIFLRNQMKGNLRSGHLDQEMKTFGVKRAPMVR